VLVIRAERFRTQEQNRKDARDRLAELVRRATFVPRPRIIEAEDDQAPAESQAGA
jgi:ribosome-associated protein